MAAMAAKRKAKPDLAAEKRSLAVIGTALLLLVAFLVWVSV